MILLTLSVICLSAWLFLVLARDGFWLCSERLTPADDPNHWPPVVSIVPARDEAATIARVISSLRQQRYAGAYQIILVDDGSTDQTATLARSADGEHQLSVMSAPPLADGWTGKLNAVAAGVGAAEDAKYLLLSDADIVLSHDTLRKLVAKAEAGNLALVSLMARLDARGFFASFTIPAFVYFFQKLYPFPAVNADDRKLAAAAGGCMLVRADLLERAGGISMIKNRLIDDCALADLIKHCDGGQKIWLGLAKEEAVSLRDNRSLASIWSMVSRSAFTQLDYRWDYLIGTAISMCVIYLAPPLIAIFALLSGDIGTAFVALFALILMTMSFAPILKLYEKPRAYALLLPVAGLLYTVMTIDSALAHARGQGGRWKGRVYPQIDSDQ